MVRRLPPDLALRERIRAHLAWVGTELSVYEIARALRVEPWRGAGKDRVKREVEVLAAESAVVPVTGPQYGEAGITVTRWKVKAPGGSVGA